MEKQPGFKFEEPSPIPPDAEDIIDNPQIEEGLSEAELMQAAKMAREENIHIADAIKFLMKRRSKK